MLWGIEYAGTIIGTIDFVTINDTHKYAEIGYVLSEDFGIRGSQQKQQKLIDFWF